LTLDWEGWTPVATVRIFDITAVTGVPSEFIAGSDSAKQVLAAAQSNWRVAKALRLLNGKSGSASWRDLRKAVEMIGADLPEIKKRPDVRALMHTAIHDGAIGDDAGHAESTQDAPQHPPTLAEATKLVDELLVLWVDDRRCSDVHPRSRPKSKGKRRDRASAEPPAPRPP
jgi:hypothetical protein